MRHGDHRVPALDPGDGDAQDQQLGHLQREPMAYPFFGCEVHLVKASTLGGIMSGRWSPTPAPRKGKRCVNMVGYGMPSAPALWGRIMRTMITSRLPRSTACVTCM